ncbi:nucleotide exchange factor GrpE [Salinibaculum rarum]|uniref:nucleotide exchange factor GrpE n=1 Tax=Salinibaculum rarum TaxID=3058903 RepID=UPI00265F0C59|nr:nucleotide exchange factor GrpE [Salinibaculum sp. KK48]
MSEQDATEADGPVGESEPTADSEDHLEDIAEQPDADPEETLDEITGNGTAGRADNGDASETPSDDADEPDEPDEELVERVADSDPEDIAHELHTLRRQLDDRKEEIEDLQSRLKRKQADFQNYKKRQKKLIEDEKERATEDLVERLLDVRDNLRRALEQDENADIRDGVKSTLKQFDEQFERENVTPIEPDPGSDVDPKRHEALATIAAEQPEDTVAEVHRPGYEMAGKVIRPAQVAISDGSQADE